MIVRLLSQRKLSFCATFFSAALFLLPICGCQTAPAGRPITAENMAPPILTLSPGDTVDITFSGATNLTGLRRVGPEGAITLPDVGPIQAAGKTVGELEKELEERYKGELRDNDVVVTLAASANVVYVDGQVGRPGRVHLDRPLTALEAILEVGGFLPDANTSKVMVTRWIGNENFTWVLNLKPLYEGAPVSVFYLHPRDYVHVPKKMQWF